MGVKHCEYASKVAGMLARSMGVQQGELSTLQLCGGCCPREAWVLVLPNTACDAGPSGKHWAHHLGRLMLRLHVIVPLLLPSLSSQQSPGRDGSGVFPRRLVCQ